MNVENRPYNQPCWEVGRRKPDWRMRSPSVEGGDTTTPSERGPLDPGGAVEAEVPHIEAGIPSGRGRAEGATKLDREARNVGIGLNPPTKPGRVIAELEGARRLKPYWGKHTVRNFWEGGWKRDYGSRTEAQCESFGTATGPYRVRCAVLYPTGIGGVAVLVLVTLAVAGFLLLDRHHGAMAFVPAAVTSGLAISSLLNAWYARPRPDVVPHLSQVYSSSFPSGHSMMSADRRPARRAEEPPKPIPSRTSAVDASRGSASGNPAETGSNFPLAFPIPASGGGAIAAPAATSHRYSFLPGPASRLIDGDEPAISVLPSPENAMQEIVFAGTVKRRRSTHVGQSNSLTSPGRWKEPPDTARVRPSGEKISRVTQPISSEQTASSRNGFKSYTFNVPSTAPAETKLCPPGANVSPVTAARCAGQE